MNQVCLLIGLIEASSSLSYERFEVVYTDPDDKSNTKLMKEDFLGRHKKDYIFECALISLQDIKLMVQLGEQMEGKFKNVYNK